MIDIKMRKVYFISLLFIVLFLLPGPDSNYFRPVMTSSVDDAPWSLERENVLSEDLTGSADPLLVHFSGQVTNKYDSALVISSSSAGTTSIPLRTGWTATGLTSTVQGITTWMNDQTVNWNLDRYHNEKWLISPYQSEDVAIPDYWTLIKNVSSQSRHPHYGLFRFNIDPSYYYSGSAVPIGWYFRATWTSGAQLSATDEIYLSQQVSAPFRDIYAARVVFRYNVRASSDLYDQVHLVVRLENYETKLHVFESGDPTDTWLLETVDIPQYVVDALTLPSSLLLEIGLATDLSGTQSSSRNALVYIDEVQLQMQVRPFPEQIALKANGTAVVGASPGSEYEYVPDGASRDCYDDSSSGVDLDGPYGTFITVGIYGTGWSTASDFEAGFQIPLDISPGAAITDAYLEVEPTEEVLSYLVGMRIFVAVKDIYGAPVTAFTPGTPHLEDRYSWIKTSVSWMPTAWYHPNGLRIRLRSPDISPLIQEAISDSTWASGRYLVIMLDYMYSSSYQSQNNIKCSAASSQDELARLYVEYLTPFPEDTVSLPMYRKNITIDYTKVAATLTDFPVLIDIADADLKTKARVDGSDISFMTGDTPLDFEIEYFDQSYNASHARLVAWVRVPTLSNTEPTVITMTYGNPNARPIVSQNMWKGYEFVHHMSQDPTYVIYDSASANHHGTSYGSMNSNNLVSGKVGRAILFDGSNDMISLGQVYTDDWTTLTLSAWCYLNASGSFQRAVSKSPSTSATAHIFAILIDSSDRFRGRIRSDTTGSEVYSSATSAPHGAWHLLTWSWDASTDIFSMYVDGSLKYSTTVAGANLYDSNDVVVIGNNNFDLSNPRFWNGLIDEVRLAPRVLNQDWILTEYRNQASPSTFYSVGSEVAYSTLYSDGETVRVRYTTDNADDVNLNLIMTMSISGEGQTLDEHLSAGTTYYVVNATHVNWSARVLVSPPQTTSSLQFTVTFPQEEWRPVAVINPLNQAKTYPTQWWYEGSTLTVSDDAVDYFGVWVLNFVGLNYVSDLVLGLQGGSLGRTANFTIGNTMQFKATVPWITGAGTTLTLTDPSGNVWWTNTHTTTGTPTHEIPSFKYRKTITVTHTLVVGDQSNFPVLIDILDTDLHDPTKVQSDGDDILFVQNGKILYHDLELFQQNYDATHARLVAWVRVNLTDTTNTVFNMYYGNPVVGPQEAPSRVWANSYSAVWHLGETTVDEQNTGILYDSSGNGYDGGQRGVSQISGKIGYAQSFDGNDWIRIAPEEGLNPPGDVTISGWFYLPSTFSSSSPTSFIIMEKFLNATHNMHVALVGTDYLFGTPPDGCLVFKMETGTSLRYMYTSRVSWSPGWYHYAVVLDADSMANNKIYINGALDTVSTGSGTTGSLSYTAEWGIGGSKGDTSEFASGSAYFNGRIDQVSVSSVIRSAGWIQTEYNNQNNPGAFYSVGAESQRTDVQPTWNKVVDSTAAAGVWTASVHYKDLGSNVDDGTGLYERNFIVKHATSLTLRAPEDAVPDGIAVEMAGDLLYVEVELTDTVISQGVAGAVVKMNWTAGSNTVIKTLNDYGTGRYGIVLDTDDLSINRRWRINLWSYHDYYLSSNIYFYLDLYHETELTYHSVYVTPWGEAFTATLVFTDTYSGMPITGATISFANGTPVTVVAASNGRYNISLPSSGYGYGNHWFVFKASKTSSYLTDATVNVTFTLRAHYTAVAIMADLYTPYGWKTTVTVQLIDIDTGTAVPLNNVESIAFTWNGGSYIKNSPTSYVITLPTNTWPVGTRQVSLSVTFLNEDYMAPTTYVFDLTIRRHYTSVTVTGDLNTPYGFSTTLTIAIFDTDNSTYLTSATVSSFTFTTSGYAPYTENSPTDLIVSLPTTTWSVGTHSTTLSVVMSGNYYNPSDHVFDIVIRKHHTSATVTGGLTTPLGNNTDVTIVIRDLDTGGLLSASVVSSFTFTTSGYAPYTENSPSDLAVSLPTTTWTVGAHSTTLSVVMSGNYYNPSDYVFQIIITGLATQLYHEPNDLVFPNGYSFQVVLRIIISEHGPFYGQSVTGQVQSHFSARNSSYTYPISLVEMGTGSGRYNLTISGSFFPEGYYTILVVFTPTNTSLRGSTIEITFRFRPAASEMSSPDRVVTTPINTDFTVTINYIDADRSVGITGASVSAINISIYNTQDLGGGVYRVTVNVQGLPIGEHLYYLTVDKAGYEAQTLGFKVIIRIAYTYAIPTVAALDIAVGNDPVFYVQYWDIDHNTPITPESPFDISSNWIRPVIWEYIVGEQRYRITFPTDINDALEQNRVVTFTFSKGPYYQVGRFNITVTIRTHNTDFRLVTAVEPTSFGGNITIHVFYGDLDDHVGIRSKYVSHRVASPTNSNHLSYIFNSTLGDGYYVIYVPASQFVSFGIKNLTLYFNWTGPVYTYQNRTLFVRVNIVGEESTYTLLTAAPPTPYGYNMTYTFLYAELYSGAGITNGTYGVYTGNVHISVSFQGYNIDPSLIDIWEIDRLNRPGQYAIRFNTSILATTGLLYMSVFINWANVPPHYNNRSDVISVRVLPRDTMVSVNQPVPTPYGANATFTFRYEDVTGTLTTPIVYNPAKMTVSVGLSSYILSYNSEEQSFYISFNTEQLGPSLGLRSFILNVTWYGAPFYANRTGIQVYITVTAITTSLAAVEPTIEADWSELVYISVEYHNLVHNNLTPGATVTYTWAGGTGILIPSGVPGRYTALLNTSLVNAGTRIVIIKAEKAGFTTATTTITLILLPLPSNMTLIEPGSALVEVPRGSPIRIAVVLWDEYYRTILNPIYVSQIYATFLGVNYPMTYNTSSGYWTVVIPGSATILEPETYSVSMLARFTNYNPAPAQFQIFLRQTMTRLTAVNLGADNKIDVVYGELVNFTVFFNAPDLNESLSGARITWISTENNINVTFVELGNGYYYYLLNTSRIPYGTWGFTFRARPIDPIYADAATMITITIKRIPTQAVNPSPLQLIWGWVGYVSFIYNDTYFNRGISGAEVRYTWGPFQDLLAIDLNNGTYLVPIDTRLLTPGLRHQLIVNFHKENYIPALGGTQINVQYVPTELLIYVPSINQIDGNPLNLQVPMGDSLTVLLFYNDTDFTDGYVGGLENANMVIHSFSGITMLTPLEFEVESLGGGWYRFIFNSLDPRLYNVTGGIPTVNGAMFQYAVGLQLENRSLATAIIKIRVINIPTSYEVELPPGITPEDGVISMVHGELLTIRIYFNDTWHNVGISDCLISASSSATASFITSVENEGNGWYTVKIDTTGVGTSVITISLQKMFYINQTITILLDIRANQFDEMLSTVYRIGLPLGLIISVLGIFYVKVFSVPKRLRQINSMVRVIRKGRVPKPIPDAKSRQELIAELFNELWAQSGVSRTAAQMPAESVHVDIPEITQLVAELTLLTRLTPQELDDFKAELSKMRLSEQASFLKDVIQQEAVRAARREGKTVEQVIAEIEAEARRQLGEKTVRPEEEVTEEEELPTILTEEETVRERPTGPSLTRPGVSREVSVGPAETVGAPSERLSQFELEELKKELKAMGVPLHEIDTIIEQAKTLSRELVDELVKSLKKKD